MNLIVDPIPLQVKYAIRITDEGSYDNDVGFLMCAPLINLYRWTQRMHKPFNV